MTLAEGTRVGPYLVQAPIGAGGMGEVYRATDSQLRRDVALKILPAHFASDPEKLERFRREAQVLASLNHPNIAQVYGLEKLSGASEGTPEGQISSESAGQSGQSSLVALVMELVEGEDLGNRIARGPMPFEDAVALARQIAAALEAAHEQGIVHRDLKPSNVRVRPDGTVKVLDFGLAKALDPAGYDSGPDAMNSPTLTAHATAAGVILGTAGYMAPEQAKGKAVDRRADNWAFGVVLWEMLTGERLFEGENIPEILAEVLKKEIRWDALPGQLPEVLRWILMRCLVRDPRSRLRDIGEARVMLDESIAHPERQRFPVSGVRSRQGTPAAGRRISLGILVATALVAGLAGALIGWFGLGRAPDPEPVVSNLSIALPDDETFEVDSYPGQSLAISRDGSAIAYTRRYSGGSGQLVVRRLDARETKVLSGTPDASQPFFSPDGRWIGFFEEGHGSLNKVSVDGGVPIPIAKGLRNAGWIQASWCDDDNIVFDTWNAGLRVIPSDGGEVRVLTEARQGWELDPQPLPGSECRFLFFSQMRDGVRAEAMSLAGDDRKVILENASHPRYLRSGHLLFVRDGILQVAPFDVERLEVTGPAVSLDLKVLFDAQFILAPLPQLAVSDNGTLVYAFNPYGSSTDLFWVDQEGQTEKIISVDGYRPRLSLSPDGTRVAVSSRKSSGARIEILDLSRRIVEPFVDLMVDSAPMAVWTPDGQSLLYAFYGPESGEIYEKPIDGSPARQVAQVQATYLAPLSISPEGRYLLFSGYDSVNESDVWWLDLQDSGGIGPQPFLVGPTTEGPAQFSPDGEWVAYVSDESVSPQVYLRKFPGGESKIRISDGDQASGPFWNPTGREIFFRQVKGQRTVMASVEIELDTRPKAGESRELFPYEYNPTWDMGYEMAISPDGKRFLMARSEGDPEGRSSSLVSSAELVVIQNWFEEIRRVAPNPNR